MLIINVSQLNTYVRSLLDGDNHLKDVYLKAEISNFKRHYKSGHLYFRLKDEKSAINAVMFLGAAKFLKFEPEDGMEVVAKASVSIYEVDGSYQAYVVDMQPAGISKSVDTMAELVEKLEKKGYFSLDNKLILSKYPRKIGVITSKTGAVIEDIKKVVERRYPLAKILLLPTVMQGSLAVSSIVEGVKALDGSCDTIIIARGGGSAEDISPFNSEVIADAVFNCKTPVISAIGHETDITICDMVADVRAGTPSIAAELATPDRSVILAEITEKKAKTAIIANNIISRHEKHLEYIITAPVLRSPLFFLENKKKKLDFIHKTLYSFKHKVIRNKYASLAERANVLESLNPMSILSRGYGAVFKGNKPVPSVKNLKKSDVVTVKLGDGEFTATVDEIN